MHVPQIERQIKVVKEGVLSTWNSLPYKKFPNRMISRMVENAFFWLNALPINSGMSSTISPRTLITGTIINFSKHWKIEFGAYAEAHEKIFPRKSTQSRTEPSICLVPTGNLQDFYWLLYLCIGRRIKRHTSTPLLVPTRVIDPDHALADANNQNPALDLFDRLGNPIPNSDTPDDENKNGAEDLTGVD